MNPNSALIWFPEIAAAGLPVPRTTFHTYNHADVVSIFDGRFSSEFERISDLVNETVAEWDQPAFVRTDLGSAKHSGPRAYRVDPGTASGSVLSRLLEDQEMKFWLEQVGPKAIMVREFLDLKAEFEAFVGLPVNREFRFFADQERVACLHPYWPADSLLGHVDEAAWPDWNHQLAELHEISNEELQTLSVMSVEAARAVGEGSWSVDFAQDVSGKWWLIDMATARDSFHWEGCLEAA